MSVLSSNREAAGRRRPVVALVVALALLAGFVSASPASADTNTFSDSTGDSETVPGVDVSQFRVTVDASFVTVTVWTVGTLPWVWEASSSDRERRDFDVSFDVDGNEWADFALYRRPRSIFDLSPTEHEPWVLMDWREETQREVPCDVQGQFGATSFSVTIPAGCLGSPAQVGVGVRVSGHVLGEAYTSYIDVAPKLLVPSGLDSQHYLWSAFATTSAGADEPPTTAPTVPIWRFWSPVFGNAHFYTAGYAEAVNLTYRDANWTDEGLAFTAIAATGAACPDGAPVFRFWSPVFQSHFYTQDAAEMQHVRDTDRNWSYEGVAYCAFSAPQPGTMALHRFWSPVFGKHFYTADETEARRIIDSDRNWDYEGVAYYVLRGGFSLHVFPRD